MRENPLTHLDSKSQRQSQKKRNHSQLQSAFHSRVTDVLDLRSSSRAANCVRLTAAAFQKKPSREQFFRFNLSSARTDFRKRHLLFCCAVTHHQGLRHHAALPGAAPSQAAGTRGSSPRTLGSGLLFSSSRSVVSVHICYCCQTVLLVSAAE